MSSSVGGEHAALAAALARGEVPHDRELDRLIPTGAGTHVRAVAWRMWTPLAVTARAVAWLRELGRHDATVLDVGAGVGKFCVAAACLEPRLTLVGVEHRAHLVAVARELAAAFDLGARVCFEHGAFPPVGADRADHALPAADVYYLYNPFGENVAPDHEHLDASVELSEARQRREVTATEAFLEAAPAGTLVLVYNGFGGRMPAPYRSLRVDYDLPSVLRLWGR